MGGERIEVTLTSSEGLVERPTRCRRSPTDRRSSTPMPPLVTVPVRAGTRLVEVVHALDAAGVDAVDVHRREATLDDVFLTLTGTQPQPAPEEVSAT